jgi:hypothetical protein
MLHARCKSKQLRGATPCSIDLRGDGSAILSLTGVDRLETVGQSRVTVIELNRIKL